MNAVALERRNPMMIVVRSTLFFEVIVFGLSVPVMILVSHVPAAEAALCGGGAAVLALISAGVCRAAWGWILVWLAQAAGLALGVLTPGMYAVGGMFALLVVISFVLGRRLQAQSSHPSAG